jgi:hypothetical protein
MIRKTIPKFKVGQIVMMIGLKTPMPFKVLGAYWCWEEWVYSRSKGKNVYEHTIRELTPEEKGS